MVPATSERTRRVPPDPTRWPDQAWGEPYPCLGMKATGESSRFQCSGKMRGAARCSRHDGVLWRKFTCSKCGRVAHDTKLPPSDWRQSSVS